MTILTLKLKNKKDATLIFDFAKKSNIELQIVEKSNGLGKPAVKKPLLSVKEVAYLKRLRKAVLDVKSGNRKNCITWEEFKNEI